MGLAGARMEHSSLQYHSYPYSLHRIRRHHQPAKSTVTHSLSISKILEVQISSQQLALLIALVDIDRATRGPNIFLFTWCCRDNQCGVSTRCPSPSYRPYRFENLRAETAAPLSIQQPAVSISAILLA
jgi:hypothetical protein